MTTFPLLPDGVSFSELAELNGTDRWSLPYPLDSFLPYITLEKKRLFLISRNSLLLLCMRNKRSISMKRLIRTKHHLFPRRYMVCTGIRQVSWLFINAHHAFPFLQWLVWLAPNLQLRDSVGFSPNFPFKLICISTYSYTLCNCFYYTIKIMKDILKWPIPLAKLPITFWYAN